MRIVEPQKSQKSKKYFSYLKRAPKLHENLLFSRKLQPKDLHSPPLEGCQISDLTGWSKKAQTSQVPIIGSS